MPIFSTIVSFSSETTLNRDTNSSVSVIGITHQPVKTPPNQELNWPLRHRSRVSPEEAPLPRHGATFDSLTENRKPALASFCVLVRLPRIGQLVCQLQIHDFPFVDAHSEPRGGVLESSRAWQRRRY